MFKVYFKLSLIRDKILITILYIEHFVYFNVF